MAGDYIVIGISLIIFVFYLITFFLLIEIKKRMAKEFEKPLIYMMIAIVFIAIRRVQQLFITSQIIESVPYISEITTFIFAALFLLFFYDFYKIIKHAKHSKLEKSEKTANIRQKTGPAKKQGKYVYLDLTK